MEPVLLGVVRTLDSHQLDVRVAVDLRDRLAKPLVRDAPVGTAFEIQQPDLHHPIMAHEKKERPVDETRTPGESQPDRISGASDVVAVNLRWRFDINAQVQRRSGH